MTTISFAFDTLGHSKKLKLAGFTEPQAELQAETMAEVITDSLSVWQDLKEELGTVKHDLNELKHDVNALEYKLIFKLSGVMIATVGLFTGILGMFIKMMH